MKDEMCETFWNYYYFESNIWWNWNDFMVKSNELIFLMGMRSTVFFKISSIIIFIENWKNFEEVLD